MRTEIILSDLVMLQMMGYIDDYFTRIESDEDPADLIDAVRARATVPGLFQDIIDKTITTQFGESTTAVRELGQNAKDAYNGEPEKKRIEFTTSREDHTTVLQVRDYGSGMSARELIQRLLIPYNSGKDADPTKVGEHGIGWYSVLDLADSVAVTSGNGKRTICTVQKDEDQRWKAIIETLDGSFVGTEVRAEIDRIFGVATELHEGLQKHLGYVSSEKYDVTFDGHKVNVLDREYTKVASVPIENKGVEGELVLNVKVHPSSHYVSNLTLTQDGFFIKDEDIPFDNPSLHYTFMQALMGVGVEFWVDFPKNVGLTKGRNNVIAKDRALAYETIAPALEQYILDFVFSDKGLVYRFDSKITSLVAALFNTEYQDSKKKAEKKTVDSIVSSSEVVFDVHGTDAFIGLKKKGMSAKKSKALEKNAKKYLKGMGNFAKKILKKKFLTATKYVGGQAEQITLSIEDMIQAYTMGILHELDYGSPEREDGVYIHKDSDLVKTIFRQLDQRFLGDAIIDGLEKQKGPKKIHKYRLQHTALKTVRKLTKREDVGYEYQAFLEAANYVDKILSKAARKGKNPIMVYLSDTMFDADTVAHTNQLGIAFNLANRVTDSIMEATRTGAYDNDSLMKLVDLVVHEKAHCVRGEFDANLPHGAGFYEGTKRKLRDQFIAYCVKNEIDVLREVNSILGQYDLSQPLASKQFAELVGQYSGFSKRFRFGKKK
ncbi:ATP-binding protein [Nanoarchaeota archaeon]